MQANAPAPAVTAGRLTISQIETILGRALKDPAFATSLVNDPATALKGIGLTPHADEIKFFKSLDPGGFATAAKDLHDTDPSHYEAEA